MHKKSTLFLALLGILQVPAWAAPTGLIPITAKELRHMQKELGMRRIKQIKPTPFGLSRVNGERVRRGLTPLPSEHARGMGKDTEIDTEADYDFENMSALPEVDSEGFGGALPATVDNSKLPSFPVIRSQSLSSCAAWAMGYYQFTHNNGLALGWANNTSDNSKKCSPKFIYNMINAGVDGGSYWSDALNMVSKHGCITWAHFPYDSNYRQWDLNPDHWQAAVRYRANPIQYVYNVDQPAGLDQMKQLLTNGYVLTYGTYINSWQYSTIKANPASSSNPLAGQKVMTHVNGTNGSHAMTVVGYDDNAWVDLNNNNVVNAGELGAFKVANSWGTSWGLGGFMWVAYDALKATSAVSGGPSSGRVAGLQSRMVYHMPVKAANGLPYSPRHLAKISLKHASRKQLSLKFGWSTNANASPTSTITPFALMNKGGAYSFNGTTTAVDGSFVMDVSELPISTTSPNKLYLTVTDNASGYAATITGFSLLDTVNSTQSSASIPTPITVDATTKTVALNHTTSAATNQAPLSKFTTNVSSGTVPLTVNFDGSSSSDSDGTISSYSWNFGDGTSASGPYVNHTYNTSGSFTATLTVRDDDGATSSSSKVISANSASTVDTTPPTVTLTAPANGSLYKRFATVNATASASDNKGVSKVLFYFQGSLKCTDTVAPYSCSFKMARGKNIPVQAKAYDAAGNVTASNISYISNP